MSALTTVITEYLAGRAAQNFAKQYVVILCIFLLGALISDLLLDKEESWQKKCILAFPAGLSAFVVTAYFLLITGIPYNRTSVICAVILEIAVCVFLNRRAYASLRTDFGPLRKNHMLASLAFVLVFGDVATSGIMPVSISNDSMYFFRRYPDIIVYYGHLRDQFDFWLTDTGLGIVSVDTLPALFGFGESFGIREFFHINFIAFFGVCAYERGSRRAERKSAIVYAVVLTVFLASATPFYILGHWALANMYFMEMFFIAAYCAIDGKKGSIGEVSLFLVAVGLFRIEGTLFVVWLVLCISLYTDLGKKLAMYVILPVTLLFGGYCLRIFAGFNVLDNIYLFLTPQKAVLLIAVLVFTGIFIAFILPMFKIRFASALPFMYIGALVLGNLVLFAYDRDLYIGNLGAFADNLFRQSGWGMFPYFVIGTVFLLVAEYIIRRIKGEVWRIGDNAYNITLTVGFLLIVLAASFGRGDVLYENVGDSGNRVLLQITPLVVMTLGELFFDLFAKSGSKGE